MGMEKRACPCCSKKLYTQCCKSYHDGFFPENALLLMRSRYSAYALGLARYIIDTTHPENKNYLTNTDLWEKEILHFSKQTVFKDLKIVQFIENGAVAEVTFIAHLFQGGQEVSFQERSIFEKLKGKWLYKEGHLH